MKVLLRNEFFVSLAVLSRGRNDPRNIQKNWTAFTVFPFPLKKGILDVKVASIFYIKIISFAFRILIPKNIL